MADRNPSALHPSELGSADDLSGRLVAGRYRVEEPLGRGGAGHVYRAIQEPLGRKVALKVLRTDLKPLAQEEFSARFAREASSAAALRHPNVVTVFDFGHDETLGLSFVVMELLNGERLADRIARGPMLESIVARIGAGLARGLRHAHLAGMVHRDVKPGNVILMHDEDGLRPVLLDFGLVKPEDSEDSALTQIGTYMGTPAYMAPEQGQGDAAIDHRADLYSLGCVLFKMLCGQPPYTGRNALAIALAHASEPVPRVRDRAPAISVDSSLESIVLRCLEKDPIDRWEDAGELAAALEGWSPAVTPDLAVARIETSTPDYADRVVAPETGQPKSRNWLLVALISLLFGGALSVAAILSVALGTWDGVSEEPSVGVEDESMDALVETTDDATAEASPTDDVVDGGGGKPVEADPVAAEPAPEPVVEEQDVPAPAPVIARPKPRPVVTRAQVVDGVYFDADQASRALEFVNTADEAALRATGVYGRGVNIILDRRPFQSLEAFGATAQIGEKTVQAVHRAASQP